jgi:mono/diheme cytochrome c family protein
LEFLEQILAPRESQAQRAGEGLIEMLAAAVFNERNPARIDRLFARVGDGAAEPSWVRLAIIRGVAAVPRQPLRERSDAIGEWERIVDPKIRAAAMMLADTIAWPWKSGERPKAAPLTVEQHARFIAGRREYAVCAACHLPTGMGLAGLAPPLVNSRWVIGRAESLVRIVLHGKQEYADHLPMPGLSHLGDETIASILTYLRRAWGHDASAVNPELVAGVRRETKSHEGPWTKDELELPIAKK